MINGFTPLHLKTSIVVPLQQLISGPYRNQYATQIKSARSIYASAKFELARRKFEQVRDLSSYLRLRLAQLRNFIPLSAGRFYRYSAVSLLLSKANLRVRRQPPGWLPSRAQLSTTCVTPRSAPRARSLSDILQSSSTFRHQTFQAPFPRPDTNIMHQFPDNSNTKWRPVLWRGLTRPASSARRLMNIWALLTWCGLGAR